jgi:hypothetical protein
MSFTDLEQRLLDKIDLLETKLDKTCKTVSDMDKGIALLKQSHDNHLASLDISERNKTKKFYYVIALMGIGFSIVQLIQLFR